MRRRVSVPAVLALLGVIAALPSMVEAAAPKKGGAYTGTVPETAARLEKRLVLKVSSSGSTGRVRLSCGDTRIGLSSKFTISQGKFTAKRTIGSDLVWRLKGKFTSSTKAKAKLYLPAVCDGKGGKVTLQLDD